MRHASFLILLLAAPALAETPPKLRGCMEDGNVPLDFQISNCLDIVQEAVHDAEAFDKDSGKVSLANQRYGTMMDKLQKLYQDPRLTEDQRKNLETAYNDYQADWAELSKKNPVLEPAPALGPPPDPKKGAGKPEGDSTQGDQANWLAEKLGQNKKSAGGGDTSPPPPPKEVIQQTDQKLKQNPNDVQAREDRARARAQSGDVEGAYADAQKVLEQNPNSELARFIVGNRSQLASAASKLKGAKLDFGAMKELQDLPGSGGPGGAGYAGGGGFGPGTGRTVAFTHMALPPNAQRFYDSAKIKFGVGDKTGALMDISRAVDGAPDSVLPLLLRAQIARSLDNPEGALSDANRALALAPDDPNALRERALAFLQLGRYDEALADLDRAAALEPGNGLTYLYRAMVLEKLGRTDEALAALDKAVSLDPALKPLAQEIYARLKPKAAERKGFDPRTRKLVRGGAVGLSVLLLLLGLVGSQKGRNMLTTTGKALFGSSSSAPLAANDAPPAPELVEGDTVGGTYKIVRELGRGGMGIVYEALDGALQRRVALKRMQRGPGTNDEDVDRFIAEARTVAQLRHPKIAEIHNVVVDRDLYLVFELVDGEPLDALLDRKLRLPPAQAARVISDVCEALGCAHDRKVIHRDLKPSNVMVEASGTAKVMDFGIAHRANTSATILTRTSASGTPPYMAPEQAMGSVSKASDLYALAVMAYELVVGRRPFEGPDFLEQKLNKTFAAPTAADPGLPKGLDAFFSRALEPDPTKRPPSAAAFAAEFSAALRLS